MTYALQPFLLFSEELTLHLPADVLVTQSGSSEFIIVPPGVCLHFMSGQKVSKICILGRTQKKNVINNA